MDREAFDEYWTSLTDDERAMATVALKTALAQKTIYRPRDWYCTVEHCNGLPHQGHPFKHARAAQRLPDNLKRTVYWRGGRGSGKTKAATMAFASLIVDHFDDALEWAVVAPTAGDARTVCMESVKSGLLVALGAKVAAGGTILDPGPYVQSYSKTTATIYLKSGGIVYSDGADDGAYRIQGKNLCIGRGQSILTLEGLRPIEDVSKGDQVWTRKGWRKVAWQGCTGHHVETVEVVTDTATLRCTPEHRVWSVNRGWVRADQLRTGDLVQNWSQDRQRGSISTANDFTESIRATTSVVRKEHPIDVFMSRYLSGLTDLCRAVTSFITSTMIERTQSPAISLQCRWASTTLTTNGEKYAATRVGSELQAARKSRGRVVNTTNNSVNTVGSRIARGRTIRTTAPNHAARKRALRELLSGRMIRRDCVTDAASSSRHAIIDNGSVRDPVLSISTVVSVRPGPRSDVFDLTVEGCSEFVASGILVHNSGILADEVGLWKNWKVAWNESIRYAVRISPAKLIVCGTPKRTMPARALVKLLLADDVTLGGRTINRQLLTRDNADNLDEETLAEFLASQGTALERQELEGEMIDDIDGALWRIANIDDNRLEIESEEEAFDVINPLRIVISIDPAVTANTDSDETGIIVAAKGSDGRGYVLEDLSGKYRPEDWPPVVMEAASRWAADRVVAEVNNGGDYIGTVLRAAGYGGAYETVRATRGKEIRAEPVAMAYQKGRGVHVGVFPDLESQMTSWVPGEGKSPDRVDALVWAMTFLGVVLSSSWAVLYEPKKSVDVDTEKPASRSSWSNVYKTGTKTGTE